MSLWPRWKASNRYRVTHLGRMSARHAFTPAEFATVILGAVLGLALSAWGLRYVAASAMLWLACAAASGVAFVTWHHAARCIMNRPSSASDEIELGWDDLLRFRQVRVFTVGAAWAPAIFVYMLDCTMASAFIQNFTGPNRSASRSSGGQSSCRWRHWGCWPWCSGKAGAGGGGRGWTAADLADRPGHSERARGSVPPRSPVPVRRARVPGR